MWCSAADTHLILLDRVVSGGSFLTGGVFECDLAHRRSVAALCMRRKIRCNPMHPLYSALHEPYVSVRVTRGAVIHISMLIHLLAAEPRSTVELLFPCQYLCGTILVATYSIAWDCRVLRAGAMAFYWPSSSLPFCL